MSKPANPHGYWANRGNNILIIFDLPLDSVHATMVLYTQEVREKQNKENKNHDAKTPEGRAKDPEETTAERGASLGEKQKKKVAGVTARLMSPRGGETKNKGGRKMKKERTITNLSWRDALRTLLYTNNLLTIQADQEEGIAHLAKGYNGEYYLITTEPDGKKPEKIKITKVAALTKLSDFFKYTRKEITSAEKILDYTFEF